MATTVTNVGADGRWRVTVEQISQNLSANTSYIRVRCLMYNDNGVRSFNGNGAPMSLSGSVSYSASIPFDIAGYSSQTVIDRYYTITHGSTGYATVTITGTLGDTSTYTFGSGGSTTTTLVLTRIPKVPDAPAKPTLSLKPPTTVAMSWSAPDNNGANILEYQVRVDDNSSFSSPSYGTTTALKFDVVGASINKRWYFGVRARNSQGWGPWSATEYYDVPNVPSAPSTPTLVYTPPTTMEIDWAAPSNGGASISGYDIQYADNPSFSNAKMVGTETSTVKTVSDLTVGKTWYFRVRAKNSQGDGDWSSAASYLVVCGPRVNVNGVWKNTISYVNVNGTWKVALPYVNVNGTWKVAGG